MAYEKAPYPFGLEQNSHYARLLCEEGARLNHEEAEFLLKVLRHTKGLFNLPRDYRAGIEKAKELAAQGSTIAREYLEFLKTQPLQEVRRVEDNLTRDDIEFLGTSLS